MSQPGATAGMGATSPLASAPDAPARLTGRALTLARALYVALGSLTVVYFIASVTATFDLLRVPCPTATCMSGQLPVGAARDLRVLGFSTDDYATYTVALSLAVALVFGAVAVVLFWRKSDDRMALFASMALLLFGLVTFPNTSGNLPAEYPGWWWPSTTLVFLGSAAFGAFLYLFPDGRFVPRWTRWVLFAWIAWQVPEYYLMASVLPLDIALWVAVGGACIYGQWYRYRHTSSPIQRQRTKWVVLGVSVALTIFVGVQIAWGLWLGPTAVAHGSPPVMAILLVSEAFVDLTLALIPISIGIAILRYQLFDVDVLINRVLVYGSLTGLLSATLVALYIGIVLLLQWLLVVFHGPSAKQSIAASTLAVAASTLAVVALFQPVRRRLQTGIDRRFYRRKYDTARALEAFGSGLRREVDLMDLGARLVATVRDTMQPSQVSLWVRTSERTEAETAGHEEGQQDALWAASLAGSETIAPPRAPVAEIQTATVTGAAPAAPVTVAPASQGTYRAEQSGA